MQFEFNPAKSLVNLEKHGIDFEAAKAIWRDYDRVSIPARSEGGDRRLMIGIRDEKLWTACRQAWRSASGFDQAVVG